LAVQFLALLVAQLQVMRELALRLVQEPQYWPLPLRQSFPRGLVLLLMPLRDAQRMLAPIG
jgi:hypothetical protein